MRVVVDDPRHQREAAGIDCLLCAVGDFSDFRNAAIPNAHVSMPGRRTQTVEKQRVADREVVHGNQPVYWRLNAMKRALAVLVFLCATPDVQAAKQAAGKFASAPSAAHSTAAPGRGNSRLYRDPRGAPELAPGRRVSEQDCSKPVDLQAGNLRCK